MVFIPGEPFPDKPLEPWRLPAAAWFLAGVIPGMLLTQCVIRPLDNPPVGTIKYQVVSWSVEQPDVPKMFVIHTERDTLEEARQELERWAAFDKTAGIYGTYSIRKVEGLSEYVKLTGPQGHD